MCFQGWLFDIVYTSWSALLMGRLIFLLSAFLRCLSGWVCLPMSQDLISIFCFVFFPTVHHSVCEMGNYPRCTVLSPWILSSGPQSSNEIFCAVPSLVWLQTPPCFLLGAQQIHVRIFSFLPVWQMFLDLLSLEFLLWLTRISNCLATSEKHCKICLKYCILHL